MKRGFLTTIIICTALFAFSQQDMKNMPGMDKTKQEKKQPVIYTCPMHPEIQSSKPGNCPKCGMKLVKLKPKITLLKPVPVTKKEIDRPMPIDTVKHQDMMKDMQMVTIKKTKEIVIKTVEINEPPKTIR